MSFELIIHQTREYYNEKLKTHGATPYGVDWNSSESQKLRFEQLLKVCRQDEMFSINDYGCGYGALVDYMLEQAYQFDYYGYDISSEMITTAKARYENLENCEFFSDLSFLRDADYTLASGIFNVKQQTPNDKWLGYLKSTLQEMANKSQKGFAFNVLTSYSDPEYLRQDLYYADPLFLFDYCKKNFSRFVTLLHDYPLYEFTILVRKNIANHV